MKFDRLGFLAQPREGGWQWGLALKSYGFPGAERVIGGVPAVKADGQRLSYDWDAAVQEWFANDARGLEHGFIVKERPMQSSFSPTGGEGVRRTDEGEMQLTFTLVTRGTL